jgi:uncharacterized protein with FMN-binding domain
MQNAKRVVVGLGVLGIFAIYSLGIRHQQPVIAKPQDLQNTNTSANTSSNTGTSSGSTTGSSTSSSSSTTSSKYKDGTFVGGTYDAYYGSVQVSVTILSGKITSVKFLQYPNTHSTSVYINQQAMPYLQQEAIQSQSANVQLISGATYTSQAFVQSLSSALSKA